MQVLFVIDTLGAGGAERSLAELLPELRAQGWDSSVAVLQHRAEGVEDDVRAQGFDVHFLEGSRLRQLRQLRAIIRAARPDVVHSSLFEADLLSRLATIGTGVAHISTLVNISYDGTRLADHNVRPRRLRAVQAIDGLTARRRSVAFIALTESVKAAAVRDLRIDPQRVTVIGRTRDRARLGEPGSARRVAARRRLDVPHDAFLVVNLGRQEWQKGQINLVAAADQLRSSVTGMIVLIAGRRGNESDALAAAIAERDLAGTVRMLGHVEDVGDLLAAADLFVFPSRYEGLGGSLIEAMALGLPIVASDVAAIREVVEAGGNADLVPADDPSALAAAIAALAADQPRRLRYGRRSLELFEQISQTPVAARTLEVFARFTTPSGD